MSDVLQIRTEGPVQTLTLNRPAKRNALNGALVARLHQALDDAAANDAVRVLVLTGAGSVFSAGADLAALKALRTAGPMQNRNDSRQLADLFAAVYTHPKPVIAKVNGHAIAGGSGLAAVCDLAVAAEGAKMGFTEVRIGFVPAIVMVFVRRKLGETVARDLLLRGRLLDTQEAAALGLITAAVAPDALDERVATLANELATETSGSAVALTKQMLAQVPGMGLHEALDYAVQMNAFARATDDCQAGIQAFLDKEPPPWKRTDEAPSDA
ncbi:enoyl-CoA hydratase/isomerase family protein [Salisaeta longa]|uniref:enoyl-CoA hydratase/isomerase family protein n=1 Tax=Salisaeta longa TaxID=503170 RepID=UPI0003B75B22|nr:enoyl-CoA hydratase-related protein [Salisaeta longa]